jgi:predicted nucleic acid-binding protein
VLYLTDSSIWIAARRGEPDHLPELLAQRLEADEVATCVPIVLELLTGPESADAVDTDWEETWRHLQWLPITEAVTERSLDLLLMLADIAPGAHRRRPTDYIVAACAESAGNDVVVWHCDDDLEAICARAGIPHEHEPTPA